MSPTMESSNVLTCVRLRRAEFERRPALPAYGLPLELAELPG